MTELFKYFPREHEVLKVMKKGKVFLVITSKIWPQKMCN